jgi:hypothetical protein
MRATVLAILLAACQPGPIAGTTDTTAPDPVPCFRMADSMAGKAQWLLDALANGDATEPAAHALDVAADEYQSCVLDYMRATLAER